MTRSESPITSSAMVPFEDDAWGLCVGDGNGLSSLVLSLRDRSPLSRSLGPAARKLPSVDLRGIDFSATRVSSILVGAETFFSTDSF